MQRGLGKFRRVVAEKKSLLRANNGALGQARQIKVYMAGEGKAQVRVRGGGKKIWTVKGTPRNVKKSSIPKIEIEARTRCAPNEKGQLP